MTSRRWHRHPADGFAEHEQDAHATLILIPHEVQALERRFVEAAGLAEARVLLPGFERGDEGAGHLSVDRTGVEPKEFQIFLGLPDGGNLHFRGSGDVGAAFEDIRDGHVLRHGGGCQSGGGLGCGDAEALEGLRGQVAGDLEIFGDLIAPDGGCGLAAILPVSRAVVVAQTPKFFLGGEDRVVRQTDGRRKNQKNEKAKENSHEKGVASGPPPCKPHVGGLLTLSRETLLDVLRDELRHLEHRDLLLAAEDSLEGVIRVDVGPLLLVLEFVLLDVVPKLFGDFAARDGLGSDDRSQHLIGLNGFHQGGVRFAGGFFFCRHFVCSGEFSSADRRLPIPLADALP